MFGQKVGEIVKGGFWFQEDFNIVTVVKGTGEDIDFFLALKIQEGHGIRVESNDKDRF